MASTNKPISYVRNPIYVFFALGAAVLLLVISIFVSRSEAGGLELALFNVLYSLPGFLTPVFITITFFGSLLAALLISLLITLKRRDIALRVAAAGIAAYAISYLLKNTIERGRPADLVSNIVPRINVSGFGFPSAYAAVSAAVGLTLAIYTPRTYRKWLVFAVFLVATSRLYLGVNMPWDIIGGWAVGIICYSLIALALGSKYEAVDARKLARKLQAAGLAEVTLKPAAVDARGSVPFFGEYKKGKIFVKVFNRDNNAADWLFKLIRRIQYRRLEDEVPSLTPKRAIEHEAYLTMLAKQAAGVRVPEVLGIYKVAANSYALAMLRINATGLDKLEVEKITDKMLDGVWGQIINLHASNIIHKDLRAANVMIENETNLPWLIDFGFSECAVNPRAFYKDNVEFIASSATKVGPKRAVMAAFRALGRKDIEKALPYMQYSALSGATTTALKEKKGLIDEIIKEMLAATKLEPEQFQKAKMTRLPELHRTK